MRVILLVLGLSLTGCLHSANHGRNDVKDVDFTNAKNWKRGRSCSSWLLKIFGPFEQNGVRGGHSIVAAAINGGISKVHVVESTFSEFVILTVACTIVYGE